MGRGLLIFGIQLLVGIAVTSIGVWAVTLPKRLQGFINENFALLPRVGSRSLIAPMLIRLAGCGLIVYGCFLMLNFKDELVWLGKIFGIISN